MDFAALLDLLRSGDAPETIYDDLSSTYNGLLESGAAKLDEKDKVISELNATIADLKSQNYDLLMAARATEEPTEPEPKDDDPEDDGDLFTYTEE